jgi:putative flippase GtrA
MPEVENAGWGRRLSRQFASYIAIGAANTLLSFALYVVLQMFTPYWLAYSLSFVAGVAFLFVANARIVFAVPATAAVAARFVAAYLLSYLVGLATIVVLVAGLGVPPVVAPLGVIVCMLPINFLSSRLVFRRPRN